MTTSLLISKYYATHPDGHFFDTATLKFLGESRSKMQVLKSIYKVKDYQGIEHNCYCLSKLSKKWDGKIYRTYSYFDTTTFDDILNED